MYCYRALGPQLIIFCFDATRIRPESKAITEVYIQIFFISNDFYSFYLLLCDKCYSLR